MSDTDSDKHERKEEEAPAPASGKQRQILKNQNGGNKKSKKNKSKAEQTPPPKPVHIQGDSVLHYAVLSGQKENVEKLLNHGMRVQHQSAADGGTPLHRAAQVGNIEIAKVLLNRSADMNAPNYLGQTSLHVALECDHQDFAKFMLSKGARKKCKHNCMRCQTFLDSCNKNKQENQRKKFMNRRNDKYEREPVAPVYEPPQVTQEELQDHMVLECERENNRKAQPQPRVEPELICRDLTYVNISEILPSPVPTYKEPNIQNVDVGDINLRAAIREEKRALGGPMFSIEENEKLRREKMRGGDFKDKSSDSSNDTSDAECLDHSFTLAFDAVNLCPDLEEKKQAIALDQYNRNNEKQKSLKKRH